MPVAGGIQESESVVRVHRRRFGGMQTPHLRGSGCLHRVERHGGAVAARRIVFLVRQLWVRLARGLDRAPGDP